MTFRRTDHGFAAHTKNGVPCTVEASCVLKEGTSKESHVISIKSPRQEVTIYVTPSGLLRVFDVTPGRQVRTLEPEEKTKRKR